MFTGDSEGPRSFTMRCVNMGDHNKLIKPLMLIVSPVALEFRADKKKNCKGECPHHLVRMIYLTEVKRPAKDFSARIQETQMPGLNCRPPTGAWQASGLTRQCSQPLYIKVIT